MGVVERNMYSTSREFPANTIDAFRETVWSEATSARVALQTFVLPTRQPLGRPLQGPTLHLVLRP